MTYCSTKLVDEPFGAVIGSNAGVPAFSCDYDTWKVPRGERDWRSYHDGVYCGAKWQCVEYARRWLLTQKGYTFADVPMAYDIINLDKVTVQTGPDAGKTLPMLKCENGSDVKPVSGSMLIWGKSYDNTGHVAIITEVLPNAVRVAEQNFEDWKWPQADYARELRLTNEDGRYTVHDQYEVLGWMIPEPAPELRGKDSNPTHSHPT